MALKVKELVAKLKSYNQEALVLISSTSDEDDLAYAYDVGWSYEDGRTNKDKVIIE